MRSLLCLSPSPLTLPPPLSTPCPLCSTAGLRTSTNIGARVLTSMRCRRASRPLHHRRGATTRTRQARAGLQGLVPSVRSAHLVDSEKSDECRATNRFFFDKTEAMLRTPFAALALAALLSASGADAFAPAGFGLQLRAAPPTVCRPGRAVPVMMVVFLCAAAGVRGARAVLTVRGCAVRPRVCRAGQGQSQQGGARQGAGAP